MSYDPRMPAAGFQNVPRPREHEAPLLQLAELDRVSLSADVRSDEGHTVPAGSTGTVVAVWNGGEAYDVEFTEPIDALVTVRPDAIGAIAQRHR